MFQKTSIAYNMKIILARNHIDLNIKNIECSKNVLLVYYQT